MKERRQRERKALRITLSIVAAVLVVGALYALWLPALRIQRVEASDSDQRVIEIAGHALSGTYAHIVPRNSIFFFPKGRMRNLILDAYPDVAAVSVSRSSFSSIVVATTPRAKVFLWCGLDIDHPFPGSCFDADAEGLVFQPVTSGTDSGTTTVSSTLPAGELRIFSPLDPELTEGGSPVRSHVQNASAIPNALRFIKAVRGMGAPVSALALRGDEADLWLGGPTRITYVLGHEEEAAGLAASTLSKLPLTDGSIQYVDLRFTGKVYVRRYGE